MHKALKASVGAALLAALTAGTWFTAQSVQSPEQRRQAIAPPPMTRITVPVERGQLEDRIQLSCQAGFTDVRPLELPGDAQVVTRIPAREGQAVKPGTLVADVQGQPIIALTGSFPFYREITADSVGPDVDQLRQGLADLGYLVLSGQENGSAAGQQVLEAVGSLAKDAGYPNLAVGEKIPSALFLVVPREGGTLVSVQTGPGPVQKPFAQLGIGGKRWLCSGKDGGIPVGVEAGQNATVVSSQEKVEGLRVAFAQLSSSAVNGGASSRVGASSGSQAPQTGGSGESSSASSTRVVVLPRAEGAKDLQARADVTVKAGPADSLIVPASALWMKEGKTLVTVVEGDPGSSDAPTRDVEVTPGMAVAGRTVIAPAGGGQLAPGAKVVVASGESRDSQ